MAGKKWRISDWCSIASEVSGMWNWNVVAEPKPPFGTRKLIELVDFPTSHL